MRGQGGAGRERCAVVAADAHARRCRASAAAATPHARRCRVARRFNDLKGIDTLTNVQSKVDAVTGVMQKNMCVQAGGRH